MKKRNGSELWKHVTRTIRGASSEMDSRMEKFRVNPISSIIKPFWFV